MTSLVNKYFNKNPSNEQSLIQRLTTEAIQIFGNTVYYLPRQLQNMDLIFGEDPLSKFEVSLPIEMYIESENWEGQSELISKFGLEIRNQLTLSVAVDRWNSEVKKIATEMWVSFRPQEGDLIYDKTTKKLLEIKFVNQDDHFYQLGKMTYAYKLKCEMFQFNGESITNIENEVIGWKTNLLDFQIMQEDNTLLLQENDESLILDIIEPERVFDTTQTFKKEADILEFDINNPFKGL